MSGARRSERGMRPAGGNGRSPRQLKVVSTSEVDKIQDLDSFPDGLVVKKNVRVVSLSVHVEVFSPEAVPSGGAPVEEGPKSSNDVPPREMVGGYTD